jgi:hypothetical protein
VRRVDAGEDVGPDLTVITILCRQRLPLLLDELGGHAFGRRPVAWLAASRSVRRRLWSVSCVPLQPFNLQGYLSPLGVAVAARIAPPKGTSRGQRAAARATSN